MLDIHTTLHENSYSTYILLYRRTCTTYIAYVRKIHRMHTHTHNTYIHTFAPPYIVVRKTQAAGDEASTGTGGGLMTAEERSTGAVEGRIYREYLRSAGSAGVLAGLVGLFLVSNFSVQLQQW